MHGHPVQLPRDLRAGVRPAQRVRAQGRGEGEDRQRGSREIP